MSVGRLAEPPKPSFLLLSKVSQSHPFMCNACKPMHLDTTAQQRDMGGENGLLSKWVRADKHHRTTTVFKISISNKMTRPVGATGAADTEEGRKTTRRAVSHRKRWQAQYQHVTVQIKAFTC